MAGPDPVRMIGIRKRFGDTPANDGIDFDLRAGEIHTLLGENGAGKSTLMNILSGLYHPDEGMIEIDGRPAVLRGPRDALAAGIGMVHQHFLLLKSHTVAENVILGLPEPRFYLSTSAIDRRIRELSREFGLAVDPRATVRELSIGERQRVEILKLLYRRTRIMILDEPTAVLTPEEIENLFAALRRVRDVGGSIVFISHKMDEVMSLSDRVTVLRGGKRVATFEAAHTSAEDLAAMMLGEVRVEKPPELPREEATRKPPALTISALRVRNDRGLEALHGVDLEIRAGEIFGLLGVAGNGQKELVEVATGLRRPAQGKVLVAGRDLTEAGPRRFIDSGVGHIPEDRLATGIVGELTLAENLALKNYRERGSLIFDPAHASPAAREALERYGVAPNEPSSRAGNLSGGNIQRLILARELSADLALLVAAYPFRGLDVAATRFMVTAFEEQARYGLGILLISEDLELALRICHRVGVIFRGVLMKVMPSAEVDVRELGLLMAGHARGVEA